MVGATAVVLPPRRAVIDAMSKAVFELIRTELPVFEQLSVDEAFGEPAGLAGASAAEVWRYCEKLRAIVRGHTGLVASIGAGSGKQIAKIASGLAKPDGVRVVSPAEQDDLLAALPVRKLWGIGPVAEARLRKLGVETIGALAALPESEASSILGAALGGVLLQMARGIDDRPVAERGEAKQISAETTFAVDITTLAQLRPEVDRVAGFAYRRLLQDGRAARTVVLKLRKADMSILTRSITLPYATADLATLGTAAQRSVLDPIEIGPIRLVGVGFGGLSTVRQGSLFPELDQSGPSVQAGGSERAEESPEAAAVGDAVSEERDPVYGWRPGADVAHPEYGHGWVQGAGHGVVTVRFETRSTGPGPAHTFAADDPNLVEADPLDSLR